MDFDEERFLLVGCSSSSPSSSGRLLDGVEVVDDNFVTEKEMAMFDG